MENPAKSPAWYCRFAVLPLSRDVQRNPCVEHGLASEARNTLAFSVLTLVSIIELGACTRSVGQVPCDEVSANGRYVGKRVTLFGTMTSGTFNIGSDKSEVLVTYACKSKDGAAVAGVQLSFDETKASHTKAAGKADSGKILQRITGVVKHTGPTILLEKVRVELSDEAVGK